MNLPTLYRSLPHPAQAKSLVAEASSLSISALADLCEENNLDLAAIDYWRTTSSFLTALETINLRDEWCTRFVRTQWKSLFIWYRFQVHHTRKAIYLDVNVPNQYQPHATGGLGYWKPEPLCFAKMPSYRLKLARRITDLWLAILLQLQ